MLTFLSVPRFLDFFPLALASPFFLLSLIFFSSPVSLPPSGSFVVGVDSLGFPTAIASPFKSFATSNGFFAPPAFRGLPIFSNLFAAGAASTNGFFAFFCLSFLTPVCLVPFSPDNCYITSIFLSLRQVRCTLLPLENDYVFQRFVSLLDIYKK